MGRLLYIAAGTESQAARPARSRNASSNAGGEQMYQGLKSLGVETQLVVYPGQFHGLTTPSYMRDRNERYLAWYGKYLKAVQ